MIVHIRPINSGFKFAEYPRTIEIAAINDARVIILDDGVRARRTEGLEVEGHGLAGRKSIAGVHGVVPCEIGNDLGLFPPHRDVVCPPFPELVRVIDLRGLTKPEVLLPKTGDREPAQRNI